MSAIPPTQDLVLEVLDALTDRGLISYESDVMPGLYRARLTRQGPISEKDK